MKNEKQFIEQFLESLARQGYKPLVVHPLIAERMREMGVSNENVYWLENLPLPQRLGLPLEPQDHLPRKIITGFKNNGQ